MFFFDKIGVFVFKMVIANLLTVVMMIIYQVPVTWRVLWVVPITMVLVVVTFGISTIVMHFGVFVEDLQNVITVVLQLVFYLSGIFYSVEKRVPEPYGGLLLKINPLALIITDLRRVMLYGQDPHWVVLLAWFCICLVLSVVGIKMVYKYENSYVKVI